MPAHISTPSPDIAQCCVQDPVARTLSAWRMHDRNKQFLNCDRRLLGGPWVKYGRDRCAPTFAESVQASLNGTDTCLFQQPVRPKLPASIGAARPCCAQICCGAFRILFSQNK